jgi:hypothetical protein
MKIARAIVLHAVAIEIQHVTRLTGLSEATILTIIEAWQNEKREKAA